MRKLKQQRVAEEDEREEELSKNINPAHLLPKQHA